MFCQLELLLNCTPALTELGTMYLFSSHLPGTVLSSKTVPVLEVGLFLLVFDHSGNTVGHGS